ncbi:MAG: hypothetical protein FWE91_08560 [Defluviitaleaceae bacterium]|nr:hypothetical protein [Defluviitaleaceae bacterium]MCL2835260.1 hypothetical protein [Defluviitaleaceae bacterium]
MESFKGNYPKILKEFGLTGTELRRDKTGHIFSTARGPVLIQKPRGSKEQLLFAHYVKESLHKAGFAETDRFIVTDAGSPFCEIGEDVYTAVLALGSDLKETRFDDAISVAAAARTVARMHNLAAKHGFFCNFPSKTPRRKEYTAFTTTGGFENHLKTMQGYKKMLKKRNRLSDFDVLFLKHFDGYERLVTSGSELVTQAGAGQSLQKVIFSHNMLKEETLTVLAGKTYITGFDECSGDHYLFDLASLIKRYVRTAAEPTQSGLAAILQAYCSQNPLDTHGIKVLYAILLFPDKFYKTCVKYYSKKRSWTPASFNISAEGLNGQNDAGFRLINDFFNVHV